FCEIHIAPALRFLCSLCVLGLILAFSLGFLCVLSPRLSVSAAECAPQNSPHLRQVEKPSARHSEIVLRTRGPTPGVRSERQEKERFKPVTRCDARHPSFGFASWSY